MTRSTLQSQNCWCASSRTFKQYLKTYLFSLSFWAHNNTPFYDCVKRPSSSLCRLRRFKIVYFTLHYITIVLQHNMQPSIAGLDTMNNLADCSALLVKQYVARNWLIAIHYVQSCNVHPCIFVGLSLSSPAISVAPERTLYRQDALPCNQPTARKLNDRFDGKPNQQLDL